MTSSVSRVDRAPGGERRAAIYDWCIYTAVGAYAVLSLLGFFGSEVSAFDEALQLLGGREVLEGRRPHLDFWSLYPPLNYYVNGLAFRLLGSSFMVARFVTAIFYGVAVFALGGLASRGLKTAPPLVRRATLVLAVFCLTRVLQLSQNNTILMAVIVLTYFLSACRVGQPSLRSLVACGVASGLLLEMRLNIGMYMVATIAATLLFVGEPIRTQTLSHHVRRLFAFGAPVVAIAGLFLLPYGRFAKAVVDQMVKAPTLILRAGHADDVSRTPTPYYCLLAITALVLLCARVEWRARAERTVALVFAGFALFLAASTLRALSAVDLLRVPFAVPAILVCALVTSQLKWQRFASITFASALFLIANLQYYLIRPDGLHLYILSAGMALTITTAVIDQPRVTRLALGALLFWIVMQFPLRADAAAVAQWLWPVNPKAIAPALRAIVSRQSFLALGDSARLRNAYLLTDLERRFFPDANEISVVRYIDHWAAPTDAVFMGLTSHDQTRVNDARLSWLMPRPLAARYLELEPGVITSEAVQREVVGSLSKGVRWLVLQDTELTGKARYPFNPSHVLDQYIAATYTCNVAFENFHVCCRGAACPPP